MNVEIPFIGGGYTARSKDLNSQVCQNLYVEIDKSGAKNLLALVACPGCLEWKDPGKIGEVRNFYVYKDALYTVVGNTVYSFTTAKAQTTIGTIGTASGWVDITSDGVYLCFFDSSGGWTYDGVTFAAITDADFQTPSGATYQDGYHIISRENTDQFFVCDQDNPTSWDATQYATAEGHEDILVSPVSSQRQLWLIGKESSEVWYNSGSTVPFDRNPGGFLKTGCNAKRSIVAFQDELMFLDDTNRVVRKFGIQLVPVSTYQIDYMVNGFTTSDAVGFMYFQEGHVFYELSFPTDSKTICYDLTTDFWHTRASGLNDRRCRANCSVRFDNKVLVGDYENGKIYEYSLSTYTDDSEKKRAIRASQFINENNNLVFFNSFELDVETGVGDAVTTDPQIVLDWSDDGGHTWSNEHWKSLGAVGEYGKRIKWRRLGKSRNRIFRITISDPVKRMISKAYLDGVSVNG